MSLLRPLLLSTAMTLALPWSGLVMAQDGLPEIGSSAAEIISPADERRYARQMLAEMRRLGWLIEDPLVEDYLKELGHRLASNSAWPKQDFTFFMVGSRDINAFATLAGYIGVNAGLVLTSEREDELAAVLAHEITHVTQRHIVRSVESARKDQLPIALAMLGAVLAASKAGADADTAQAAISGGIALMQQRQINHTRANEHEADRIGIQILSRSGYDPMAMADFFGRMLRANRSAGADVPELLRTHPVTTTRISEAKDRAAGVAARTDPLVVHPTLPLNPGLPTTVHASLASVERAPGRDFEWMRERIRVLTARTAGEAAAEYRRTVAAGTPLSDAEHYGYAIARTQLGNADEAIDDLAALHLRHPDMFLVDLALAEAEYRAGRADAAEARYAELAARQPQNRAIVLSYSAMLAERGRREDGLRAQAVLRPLLATGLDDPAFQRAFARASELAGDMVRAGEAHAEAAFLTGRAEDALNQLQRLKDSHALDYVQRSRIDSRIAAMTPIVLQLRADGIRAGGRNQPLGEARPGLTIHAHPR
jgi:beta-barrel assembly-enhancing protease